MSGIVVPAPKVDEPLTTAEQYRAMRAVTGATHIRINVPIGCDVSARFEPILAAGLDILPLFDLPKQPSPSRYGGWIHEVLSLDWGITDVEFGNEPHVGPDTHYSPEDYALHVIAAEESLPVEGYRIWIAGEVMDCAHGRLLDYHQRIRNLVPRTAYYGVAIHPYRDPKPWWWSRYRLSGGETMNARSAEVWPGGRLAEWLVSQDAIGGLDVPLLVTEVGWRLSDKCSEQDQADNLRGEIAFWRTIPTCHGVCVYTAQGNDKSHGIFQPDWVTPRLAAKGLFT
jgi:hypothetical protein